LSISIKLYVGSVKSNNALQFLNFSQNRAHFFAAADIEARKGSNLYQEEITVREMVTPSS
jgi:hypothetical protein